VTRLRLLVALCVAIVGSCSSSSHSANTAASVIPPARNLDPGAQELVSLLARGRTGTWHAVYTVTRPTGQPGETSTLEVWRLGARTRQDTVVTSGAEPVHTVGITDGRRRVACTKTGSGGWRCERISAASLDADATFLAAIGDLGHQPVAVSDATVAGQPGRCFAIGADGAGQVCVSTDGVPLRIARQGASIELVKLDRAVPSSTFTAPS
jgi:hypothetical protein